MRGWISTPRSEKRYGKCDSQLGPHSLFARHSDECFLETTYVGRVSRESVGESVGDLGGSVAVMKCCSDSQDVPTFWCCKRCSDEDLRGIFSVQWARTIVSALERYETGGNGGPGEQCLDGIGIEVVIIRVLPVPRAEDWNLAMGRRVSCYLECRESDGELPPRYLLYLSILSGHYRRANRLT